MLVHRSEKHGSKGILPQILTTRDRVLALSFWPSRPTVTVEIATKWYGLWLMSPLDKEQQIYRLDELHYGVLKDFRDYGSRPYAVDHVPNPNCVLLFCKEKGYALDDLGLELMIGRWATEVEEKFSS